METPKDRRDCIWRVVEKDSSAGDDLKWVLHIKAGNRWRNKHRILGVVNKSKPFPGVQIRSSSGTFLVSTDNLVAGNLPQELATALKDKDCSTRKRKRTVFCGKCFLLIYFCVFFFSSGRQVEVTKPVICQLQIKKFDGPINYFRSFPNNQIIIFWK